jgi:hypothetical protein
MITHGTLSLAEDTQQARVLHEEWHGQLGRVWQKALSGVRRGTSGSTNARRTTRPANAETWKNLLVIPELHARVTLLNEKNEVVARLGEDVARVTGKDGGAIRGDTKKWLSGKFVHPHDACFAHDGSIYVAEWVATGRVTKLKRV